MLRQLGHSEHHDSHPARLNVLTKQLGNTDPRIRDAAGLGLGVYGRPDSVAAVARSTLQKKRTVGYAEVCIRWFNNWKRQRQSGYKGLLKFSNRQR